MEPRHFMRRLIAAVVDIVIFSQLAVYLVAPFADGDTYRLSGGLYQSVRCQLVPLEPEAIEHFSQLGVKAENGSLCRSYENGLFAGTTLLVSSHTNANGDIAQDAITLRVPLDASGADVTPVYPVALVQPLLVFSFFVLLTYFWKGQTIGKKLTGICLRSTEGQTPGFWQVLHREGLKFAPAIILFAISQTSSIFSLEHVIGLLKTGENIALVFGFLGGSTFMYILWWVAPLIWWNGTMPYDRIAKTEITRVA